MKIGAAQLSIGNSLDQNIRKIISFLGRAAVDGIDLLCFPEMCLTGYNCKLLSSADLGHSIDDAIARIHEECRMLNVGAIIGHAYPNGEALANRATVLLPDNTVHSYDKTHLVVQEQKHFVAGDQSLVFSIDGFKAGIIICRDQNDPMLVRQLAEQGAGILFILAAHLYPPKEARWKIEKNRALPVARAVENRMYVILSNAVGSHVGYSSLGNSLIVDPDGAVVVSAGESEETIISIDLRNSGSATGCIQE